EKPDLDSIPAELRESPGERRTIERLDGNVQLAMDLEGAGRIRHHLLKEEQHAESMKDRQIRAPREPLPIRERLPRHPRVDLIGSIGGSRQARLTARGGASIAGPLGVEEQHPLPLAKQIPRGPTAEDARSDD